jgi:uncharacterized membrane protein (UPF0127 family)
MIKEKKIFVFLLLGAMLLSLIYIRGRSLYPKVIEANICHQLENETIQEESNKLAKIECFTKLRLEVADTLAKQKKGLAGRSNLSINEGMLFSFGMPTQPTFWMKGMNFPLDFLWIRDGIIVEITENVPPPRGYEYPRLVKPQQPVTQLIETKGGLVKEKGIKIGDVIKKAD